MGLDMYLYSKTYISNSEWVKPEMRREVIVKKGGEIDPNIDPKKIKYVVEEVGYWRKANAIHKWFIDNVQNGIDDCGTYTVKRSQLQSLYDICKEILESRDKAPELLPSQSGFFFGGTEYDDGYFGDLATTMEIIEGALSDQSADYFEYHSSW